MATLDLNEFTLDQAGQASNASPQLDDFAFDAPVQPRRRMSVREYMAQVPQAQIDAPNRLERFGAGMDDVYSGVQQLLSTVRAKASGDETALREWEDYQNENRRLYATGRQQEAQREGLDEPDIDWWRGAGAAVPTTLAAIGTGGASLPGQMAAGAAWGAGAGLAQYAEEGADSEQKLWQVGGGVLGGALAPPIMRGGAGIAKWGGGKLVEGLRWAGEKLNGAQTMAQAVSALKGAGGRMAEWPAAMREAILRDARAQLRTTGHVDGELLGRRVIFERLGFRGPAAPMKHQLTGDAVEFGTADTLAKTGGSGGRAIAERKAVQQTRLGQVLKQMAGRTRGTPNMSPYGLGRRVMRAVQKKADEMQGQVSGLYRQVRDTVGDKRIVSYDNILRKIDDEALDTSTDAEGILNVVYRYIDKHAKGERLTVSAAEELRKAIGREGGKASWPGSVRRMLQNALDDDVAEAMAASGSPRAPAFQAARQAAKARFAELEPLVKLLDEKIKPEDFLKRFVDGGSVDQLGALKKTLLEGTTEQVARGRQVWNTIRRHVIEQIDNKSRSATRGRWIEPGRTESAIGRYEPEEIALMFGDDGIEETLGMWRKAVTYLTDVTSPLNPQQFSGTTPAAANLIMGGTRGGRVLESVGEEFAAGRILGGAATRAPIAPPPPGVLARALTDAGRGVGIGTPATVLGQAQNRDR